MRPSIHRVLLLAVIFATASFAQNQAPQDVENRLRHLEARAKRADQLEKRLKDVEAKLRDYESAEAADALSRAVDDLVNSQAQPAHVRVRKAIRITLGGQIRLRSEYRTVTSYRDPPGPGESPDKSARDEDFTIQRTRVTVDAQLLEDVRVFVEIQDSRVWGSEQGVLVDQGGVDLHQGYVDFENAFGSELTLRFGRFEMSLWNQRFISPLDWHPVGRAWDGLYVFGMVGDVYLQGGYQILAEDVRVDSDQDADFYWAAATYKGVEDHRIGVAFFWLHNDTDGVVINDPADYSVGTIVAHADGKFDGFDYSVDLALQFGDLTDLDQDVFAYAVAVILGYTFDGDWKPRVALEYALGSGDTDPTDGDSGSFNPLFPFGHFYHGHLDLFSWRNSHDVAVHLQVKPAEDWWIGLAVHGLWLHHSADAWYGVTLRPTRFDPSVDDNFLGYEFDISAKYWFSKDVWLWFGYSFFSPGDYIDDTGDSPNTHWFWIQLTATF